MSIPPPTGDLTFPTKVDAWLVLLVVGALVAALAGVYATHRTDPSEARFALVVIGGSWALIAALGLPCEYTLAADHLVVRSGLVRWRIPYVDISDIAPSREIWAAPAMSLQRVKISHGHGRFALVSPRERERFITELAMRIRAVRGA